MKPYLNLLALLVSASFFVGCTPSGGDAKGAMTPAQTKANDDATKKLGATPPTESKTSAPDGATEPAIDAKLKTDAYNYYGLANRKTLTYSYEEDGSSSDGTQTITFKEMRNGFPVYSFKASGAMDKVGDQEMMLKDDGIYVTQSKFGKLDTPMLQLPADASPGKTWMAKDTMRPETNQKITLDGTYKVEGKESITVPAGTFQAIKVTAKVMLIVEKDNGSGKPSITKTPVTATEWDAPGVGTIKNIATSTEGGQTKTTTITLKKQE